jgi:multidrug efflux pump subunit AcrB
VIVCTSIPLAIFSAIVGLKLTGHTINIMTLGGLALAIGMLVDDATVEVENIHRNRHMGKPLTRAILDGAQQIAVPAIVATLSICIVFFPVVLLVGPARFLFTPLAISVVLAMIASYVLSRTLVPALARMLMHGEHHDDGVAVPRGFAGVAVRFNRWRDRHFERFQNAYGSALSAALHHRRFTLLVAAGIAIASLKLATVVGTDFFPSVDAGLMKLHFRAPTGTRVEETEGYIKRVEADIRSVVPDNEIETINAMLGVPVSYNLAFVQTDNVSSMDAELLIALKPEHGATAVYMQRIRELLGREFPGCNFYFQPADIVSQVLNFGLSAPIDVQVEFPDLTKGYEVARRLRDAIAETPGTADAHIVQVVDYPSLNVNVDRLRAAQAGITERDVANNLLVSLSSSGLVSPSFFLNPKNNVNYTVVVKSPLPKVSSVERVMATPLTPAGVPLTGLTSAGSPSARPEAPTQLLSSVAEIQPGGSPEQINHYTVQRVIDVGANVHGRDLGAVAGDIEKRIDDIKKTLPPGMRVTLRGQNQVMNQSFRMLGLGLILATLLVYCLMVILFQSWLDPFIIMVAVPGAIVGILWMLAFTHTTINVESLMGSIMSVGIAVSNSILLVSFANDIRIENEKLSPLDAALEAGRTRLRPVIMTAMAMIIGMIPMALGLGEAGEQNAPLGRAVIGGLALATVATLFVVPVVYASLRKKLPSKHVMEQKFLAEEREGI